MKKEIVIRLTEKQLESALEKTITEAKEKNKNQELITESWFVEMVQQMGDFVYTHFPNLFKELLSFNNQWKDAANPNSGYNFNDPEILKRAKDAVGQMVSIPAGVATLFGAAGGTTAFMNKYRDKLDKIKEAFYAKMAKS